MVLILVLFEAIRMESRAARSDAALVNAIAELTQAKRDAATELQLRRYNLDWFRAHEFAEQQVKIGIVEARLNDCRRN